MILKEFVCEGGPVIEVASETFRCKEHFLDALVLENPIARIVDPDTALAAVDHAGVQVLIQFVINQGDILLWALI